MVQNEQTLNQEQKHLILLVLRGIYRSCVPQKKLSRQKMFKCTEGAIDSQEEDYQKEGDSLFSKERIPISLFFKEQQERIAHGRFFVKSEERLERFALRHKKGKSSEKLSYTL